MGTQIHTLRPDESASQVVSRAARCLREGGLVVFPTETVYGVGACATNPAALRRLREIKGRAETKPFTLHIGTRAAVNRYVPDLTGAGRRLIQKAWPGPLTVIFSVSDPSRSQVIQETSPEHIPALYHDGTIGIRCPDDPIAGPLLTEAGVPVVAASANPAGEPAPIDGDQAIQWFDGQVDYILNTGRTRYGKASTIVRVDPGGCTLIREGVLDERTIRRLTRVNFLLVCTGNTCRSPMGEALLRQLLASKLGISPQDLEPRGYHVESAGLAAVAGAPASEQAVAAMRRRGLDLSAHRSTPLSLEAVQRADYIFLMTAAHLASVVRMVPSAADRCRILADQDIEDPVGGDEEEYLDCARNIEQALRRHLKEIPL